MNQIVYSCHKRGISAIGGMSAFIPNRKDPEVTEKAFENVKNDKLREANMGFDGSWVAHPDLVSICKDVFNDHLNGEANQISFVNQNFFLPFLLYYLHQYHFHNNF